MTDFYNLVPNAPKGRYDGIERLEAPTPDEALRLAAVARRHGMDFGTVRGPMALTSRSRP